MRTLFRNPLYMASSLGHFANDVMASSGPILVTFFSVPMALTGAQIGLSIGAFQFFSAISQPLFGLLADRIGSRWLGPISLTWIVSFMSLAIFVAQVTNSFLLFFILFVVASLGSGAFHPLGTKHAAEESGPLAATGTAVFFLFGQTGLASGPILAGVILESVGTTGIYILALCYIPLILFMLYAMKDVYGGHLTLHVDTIAGQSARRRVVQWGAISLLAVLTGLRSWAAIGTVSFLPKLFQEMGWQPAAYGAITGVYWMSSAILGVFAGHWADRWGRRQVVFTTLIIGSVALYFLPLYNNWGAFVLAVLTGGFLGASHSILVVVAQSLLPGRPAFASGVILGYLFGVGAIAAWAIGWLGDIYGLGLVLQAGGLLTVTSAILALFLPSTRESEQPQAEGVPA